MDSILERRRAYEQRMSQIAVVEGRMDALVQGDGDTTGLAQADPEGVLQEALRALLGLALHRSEFELEIIRPDQGGSGFRMSKHDGELQFTLLPQGDGERQGAEQPVTAQLADLLRGG